MNRIGLPERRLPSRRKVPRPPSRYLPTGQGQCLRRVEDCAALWLYALFKSSTNTFIIHIPYRGAAAGITAILAGEVDMIFDNLPSAIGQIQAGSVKALAVTTVVRSKALPDVPTLVESGLTDFDVSAWFGLAAPAGMAPVILSRLEQVLEKVSKLPEVAAAMQRQGAEPGFVDNKAMAAFWVADAAKWKRVAAYAKITLD